VPLIPLCSEFGDAQGHTEGHKKEACLWGCSVRDDIEPESKTYQHECKGQGKVIDGGQV